MSFPSLKPKTIEQSYALAKDIYAQYGIDTGAALERLANVSLSMHCWQGDDVRGFETSRAALSGGIMATGNHPGAARTLDELRADIDMAFSLIPGKHRLNLHAIYLDNGGKPVDRDAIEPSHFKSWVQWAQQRGIPLDFNPSFFSHPKSADGMTLSHPKKAIRAFWIEHGKRSRAIAASFAKAFRSPVVNNFWVPDGTKDNTFDRWGARERLIESYDSIFSEPGDKRVRDAIEGKLFGIGSESFVTGSNEFCIGYALSRGKLVCLDMGHFHPTETIHDKLSAILPFAKEILIHVSRPIRWDSDHVVILNDDLLALAREIILGDALNKVWLATDFFDASICRIGAWAIGLRATQQALLNAMLEPTGMIRSMEAAGRGAETLALAEVAKSLPSGAVWDYFCMSHDAPAGADWITKMADYERDVLLKRG